MQLKRKNIGALSPVSIDISSLMFIIGKNDSRKSTVGKVLYALTRVLHNDKMAFRDVKRYCIRRKFRGSENLR